MVPIFQHCYILYFSDPAYSCELLGHAKALYDFATGHRKKYSDSITDAGAYYS